MKIKTFAMLLALLPLTTAVAEERVKHREAFRAASGAEVTFDNLAGEVILTAGHGNEYLFEVEVVAENATLASKVTLKRDGNEVWVEYPLKEYDEYVYRPDRGGNSNTTTTYRDERVRISSRGRGAEVHANVKITVPAGADLTVNNRVGTITAGGVRADLKLSTGSGRINATGNSGGLVVKSGSGSLNISDHDGELVLRTGSGNIDLKGITGDVNGHTGSGGIDADRIAASEVRLRTGSGGIEIGDVTGDVNIGTGSGSIRIGSLSAATELNASTGSGSIRVRGDIGKVTRMKMTTGSGSIRVESSGIPNLKLHASAGSGSVSVDVPGMQAVVVKRHRVEAILGSGDGEARLSTGSGSIHFEAGK